MASVPYIGSHMSLISKAEIRYEGFLHEIDTANTTVTLRNVKSFGTEQRRADKVVPPKDEVYQYIIFRGSDIKDISVCENTSAFSDPAIVQSGPASATAQAPRASNPTVPSSSVPSLSGPSSPTAANFTSFGMPSNSSQAKPRPPSVPSPQLFGASEPQHSPEPTEFTRSSNDNYKQQYNRAPQSYSRAARGDSYERPNRGQSYRGYQGRSFNYQRNQNQDYPRNQEYQRNQDYSRNQDYHGYNASYDRSGPVPLMGNQRNTRGFNYQQTPRWSNPGGRYNQSYNNAPRQQQGPLKLDEFDIDGANKKFDKSQLIKEFSTLEINDEGEEAAVNVHEVSELEEGEVEQQEAARFYDKAKSFFDNISCDTTEKKGSRLTSADEKKLNAQTFGISQVYRNTMGPRNPNSGQGYPRRGNYYGGFNSGPNYRRGGGMSAQSNYYTNNYNGSRGRGGSHAQSARA